MPLKPVIAGMFYRSESGALKPLIAGMAVQGGSLKPLIAGFLYKSGGDNVSGTGTIQGYSTVAAAPPQLDVTFLAGAVEEAHDPGITIELLYSTDEGNFDQTIVLADFNPGGDTIWGDTTAASTLDELAVILANAIFGASLSNISTGSSGSTTDITSNRTGAATTLGATSASLFVTESGGGAGADDAGEIVDAEVIAAVSGKSITLDAADITTNAEGFDEEWELYWSPSGDILFTSTPPTDPNLTAEDIFSALTNTTGPENNSLRARITGTIPNPPQQIVTVHASGVAAVPSAVFHIVDMTDIHIGRGPSTYDPLIQPQDCWAHIVATWPDAVAAFFTGDISDHSLTTEYDDFLAALISSGIDAIPNKIIAGNHDEGEGLVADGETPDGPRTYDTYDLAGLPHRFTYTQGPFFFIFFESWIRRDPDPLFGFGNVSSTDLDFVEAQLESNDGSGLIPVLVTHYPLLNAYGNNIKDTPQTALYTLIKRFNVPFFMSGHKHFSSVITPEDVGGTTINHFNRSCLAYNQGVDPDSGGAFIIWEVDGLDVTFRTYSRVSPFGLLFTDNITFGSDFIRPVLLSATIPSAGTSVVLVFNKVVQIGAGGNGGWTPTITGGAATMTYASGDGSNTLVYSLNRTVLSGQTGTADYVQPLNGIEDLSGNDLLSIAGVAVTNNSSQSAPPFIPYSVVFDGTNDWLSRGADLDGNADNKSGTISVWFKTSFTGAPQFIMGNNNLFFTVQIDAVINIDAFRADSTQILRLNIAIDARDGNWHHLFATWALNDTNDRFVYLDGVDVTSPLIYIDDTIDWTRSEWTVGSRGDAFGKFNGLLAEPWFDNSFIGDNVELFRSAGGDAVDLGEDGGTPMGGDLPLIYLHSEFPNWETNLASGGGFTENGALADGGADRPPS